VSSTDAPLLKYLIACDDCARQYDVNGLAEKSRFRCLCGTVLEVPRFQGHDAAVVRCTSCGAPRTSGAESCKFCSADYTLHERDLHTICSSCMARVSDKARFCHHCGTPIVSADDAGEATDRSCPTCGVKHLLHSRKFGSVHVSLLECGRCAGIWLDREAFELLADKARVQALPEMVSTAAAADDAGLSTAQKGPLYRHCPRCREMMNRRNFGRRSGVIVDVCKEHGTWFDAHELDRILRWVRRGGEERAASRDAAEARHTERQDRLWLEIDERAGRAGHSGFSTGAGRSETGWVGELFGALFDI